MQKRIQTKPQRIKAPTYDMRITFEDGTSADVHGIVLEDLRTLTIREKDGIVYGTYKLKSTKRKKRLPTILRKQLQIKLQQMQQRHRQQLPSRLNPMTAMIILTIIVEKIIAAGDDYSGGEDGGDGCLDNGLLRLIWGKAVSVVMDRYLGRINTGQGSCTEKSSGELLSDLERKYVVSI